MTAGGPEPGQRQDCSLRIHGLVFLSLGLDLAKQGFREQSPFLLGLGEPMQRSNGGAQVEFGALDWHRGDRRLAHDLIPVVGERA